MLNDLLLHKAIELRETVRQIHLLFEEKQENLCLSEKEIMNELERACTTSIEMGKCFIELQNWKRGENTPEIFQRLVDHHVIDERLSKRLLSLISFGKLLRHIQHLRGKNCRIKLKHRQLEDFHAFTQNLLLA